ncbi:MAG: 4-alpha-glucanotransferase, partial [Deltaproteobacteria bacterium]
MQPTTDSPLFSLLAGRAAGMLCHITSVPGSGPVGNLGDARNFARWLSASGVRIWQVLPLNPTDPATGNSPYSSHSAFALNPILVDPGALEDEGLLLGQRESGRTTSSPYADYTKAIERSSRALEDAFGRFEKLSPSHPLREDFDRFCSDARWWLDDYCLYAVLKRENGNRSWTEWPAGLASREPDDLERARRALDRQIRLKAFCQFVLQRQLEALRALLGELGILLFG